VTEGWVSPRDFLLGLALIQAFPGPNFNCESMSFARSVYQADNVSTTSAVAVYLGSLAAINASLPSAAGAVLGFLGIFGPGLILVHGTMGIWAHIRSRPWIKSCLRGVNAAAVGLIFSAVYRLWQIGFVDEENTGGSSLGRDPWWVVIAATSYVGVQYFQVPVPVAIVLGGIMGLIWYGITS
jgi:chromate transport protein ChrA